MLVGRRSLFVLPAAARHWLLCCGAVCVGRCCFMCQPHFLSLACTVREWYKASGAVMPRENEKECLWNHFPLCLPQNWTGLISCQNKYSGYTGKDVWTSQYYSTRGRVKYVEETVSGCLTGISMQRCKFTTVAAEKLSLKLPLCCSTCESRRDNGSSLISLFGLLV